MCSTVQKMQQVASGGAYKNEFMIIALAVVAAAMLLLLIENAGDKTYLKLFLVGLALVCWRTWSFFAHIKLYYKEK